MSSQHARSIPFAIALAVAAVLASPPASAAASGAHAPAELFLNTTLRHAAVETEPGEVATTRFQIDIPQAGLLALNLTVAGGAQAEPLLRLLDQSLSTIVRATQTPNALLVEAEEAGTLLVEVAALEPGQRLPAFKLRSAFQEEVDPWDDDLPGPKPPPAAVAPGDPLCAQGEQDDVGDVPLCASPIGSAGSVSGVLHNDTGDDEDVFTFRLPATAVIAVEAVTDSGLQLVLRDRDGLAVATAQSQSGGVPLHLTRALAAGRYFLEVEGLNGDGAEYVLTLQRPNHP